MSDDRQPPAAPEQGSTPSHGEAVRDPWAPPQEPKVGLRKDAASPPVSGPGDTVASGTPVAPAVHEQQTITSLPAEGWAAPTVPPSPGGPPAGLGNPFAPPVPPVREGQVPPPPIGPEGPGHMPYGYPQAPVPAPAPAGGGYYGWPGVPPMPANGMGTTGLVLGIVAAVVFCLWPLAIVLGVLGVIFGAIGRGKANRGEATNGGQALAGIICGAGGVVLGIAVGVLVFVTR
jgi:hypothetical protein